MTVAVEAVSRSLVAAEVEMRLRAALLRTERLADYARTKRVISPG